MPGSRLASRHAVITLLPSRVSEAREKSFLWKNKLQQDLSPLGCPDDWAGKEATCNAGDTGGTGSIPELGKSPGGGNGNPSHILAWKIPWTEEPGGLQSKGLQRVRHNRAHKSSTGQIHSTLGADRRRNLDSCTRWFGKHLWATLSVLTKVHKIYLSSHLLFYFPLCHFETVQELVCFRFCLWIFIPNMGTRTSEEYNNPCHIQINFA